VSRQTDYVVAGEETGAKLTEAGKLGVKVINAEEFRDLLGVP
jgi:DNA ligase (NAD+)